MKYKVVYTDGARRDLHNINVNSPHLPAVYLYKLNDSPNQKE